MSKLFTAITLLILILGCSTHHHDHEHTPHSGVIAEFKDKSGTVKGFAELKLHDDKGDLELWLTGNKVGSISYDLPLDSTIKVTFPKLGKKVQLQVRNKVKNEDEDGKGNIRSDKTNYFIFPGDTGADASYLLGKEFSSEAVITFSVNGKEYTTGSFTLEPHVH